MSTNLNIWWRVPNGSTIKLWVDDQGSEILARARVIRGNETERAIEHSELVPGPAEEHVTDNLSYTVRPAIVFQGASNETATIHAQLVGPNGNVIPDASGNTEYSYNVQGEAGDNPARATLTFVNKNA